MHHKHLYAALAACGILAYPGLEGRLLRAGQDPPAVFAASVCLSPGAPRARSPGHLGRLVLARAETGPFDPALTAPGNPGERPPPLFADLGTLSMPVSTNSPEAQRYFDQGLRLAFAFNHAEAQKAFRAAQRLDPQCAMCYWGEALVLGPNINAPMFPEAVAPAHAAASRANALAEKSTPRERALIAALTRRYTETPGEDRTSLDTAYADAMKEVAARFPEDDTIQVLFAESLMDLTPWDYWEEGGKRPKGRNAEMIASLERVLARNPDHPGAIHLYIHAVEASSAPERALPHARRLAALMPGAGHIVHMPAHIYYRIGLYRASLETNVAAVAADERYFARAESDPLYRNSYYPHNLHFLMMSAQMGGHGAAAIDTAAKLDAAIDPEFVRVSAALQPIKAAPYFTHAQFSPPETILALPDPGDEFVLVKAMWHYARAVAQSAAGKLQEAEREIAALAKIEAEGDFKALTEWMVPGREVVQTARHVAQGRLADARGDLPAAARAYGEAIAIQDRLAYMEPPYWYYPVRQSLGAVLLRMGRVDEAERVFLESLAAVPNNGWALYGLKEVHRRRGDAKAERGAGEAFARAWFGDRPPPGLSRL